ncbi:bifunctional aspartate kinase/homoserine dehydrogenase I [Pustulibacterium marinum]|uniref:bifunctional aspartate kinase/homoserine dehydrogenase I n=1 Tax=Pustulibacterium marinum TaxID=1224947 RepID=UPI000B80F488|nr:bifunctional aspartate kinase/homoserine dehydrogenase I [Pustulibacterium marinum]
MENKLTTLHIQKFTTECNHTFDVIPLSYQQFGQPLGTAPVVLINHALTGNSNVSGKEGWWNALVGKEKSIDTDVYTIISFNIPGNGFDGFVLDHYKSFVARDMAKVFLLGLAQLTITKLYALIGGSLGGGLAWEMCALNPKITQHLITIATDWKATDWLIANCQIQEQILNNSNNPVHDARMHAMLCYRTPASFKAKFQRSTNADLQIFNVESWLLHHGKKLQERFQVSAYKLMNQLLKTIDVTRGREENTSVFEQIEADIHIVGVDSDLFFSAEENRETHRKLAQSRSNVTYGEIKSVHGHDAFLIEFEQLEKLITKVFPTPKYKRMKVVKFGGKSLANGEGLQNTINIIQAKLEAKERIALVVSARGKATDQLESLLEKAARGKAYQKELEEFKAYQTAVANVNLSEEFSTISKLLEGVALLHDYSKKIKDNVLSQGEIISGKTIVQLLQDKGVNAIFSDSRQLIVTDNTFGNAQPNHVLSKENVVKHFEKHNGTTVHVVTGFIAATETGETTTLGRNGSNYTASLLANYLDAEELQNYTHVDGIFTANPDLVSDAEIIKELSFEDANELANFGANILHAKTIIPLIEKNIPLRILNTFNAKNQGTLIHAESKATGIKSVSTFENVALINLEGRGLLGKAGVDARIFKALGAKQISVSIIAQGSSERGIGLVVDAKDAFEAKKALEAEFEQDFYTNDVSEVYVNTQVSVISIVGQELATFNKPYDALIKNQIVPLLLNNTVTGKNVSLVVKRSQVKKAINIIHGEIFGISKKVNLVIFGRGTVGGTLIEQINNARQNILDRKDLAVNVVAIVNSTKVLFNAAGITGNWEQDLVENGLPYENIDSIIQLVDEAHLGNLIAVDATASKTFVENYIPLVKNGFDLVSANKIANTISFDFYQELREVLSQYQKKYLYETNVGAGLPLIDTISLLHNSGENITRIKGVFSGTLSYLFNTFSESDQPFSDVLKVAIESGYTEPDPRDDLSGVDVGRKLLILARELELRNEFADVNIQNLIPENLQDTTVPEFLERLEELNPVFDAIKKQQKPNHVLRYVGDLHGDLFKDDGAELDVKLVSVPKESALGQVKGSDSIFEIYTESYGEHPIVIQGAGAGAAVTARGVFGDILRLAEKNIH